MTMVANILSHNLDKLAPCYALIIKRVFHHQKKTLQITPPLLKGSFITRRIRYKSPIFQVIRLASTNPGKWFLHCHIEVHALEGMAMVLNEAPEHTVQAPPGFPVCNNFYNDRSRDMQFIKNQKCENLYFRIFFVITPTNFFVFVVVLKV